MIDSIDRGGCIKRDRITQLRVKGMRVIDDVTLDLQGLTVLIGDNGTGKSTLLDAFELLRQAAKPLNYCQDVMEEGHGGLLNLLRRGAPELTLGIAVEGEGPRLEYEFAVSLVGTAPAIVSETLDVYPGEGALEPLHALDRTGARAKVFDVEKRTQIELEIDVQMLVLTSFGLMAQPAFKRVIRALDAIDHQVSFETRAVWQQREMDIRVGPRWPSLLDRAEKVARYGLNLPSCFQALRNLDSTVWDRVLERARLGLGSNIRDFRVAAAGGGNVDLEIVFGSMPDRPVPVRSLSEGQLSYLLFIALVELNTNRSVLVFDEPETHLHPSLLARVVWILEQVAADYPIVLATHSDRLLDALESPESSVVLCDLDHRGATRLRRPNRERLEEWLQDYRGLGSLRAEGYEAHVFDGSITISGPGANHP